VLRALSLGVITVTVADAQRQHWGSLPNTLKNENGAR
jgi:hypothetical protein